MLRSQAECTILADTHGFVKNVACISESVDVGKARMEHDLHMFRQIQLGMMWPTEKHHRSHAYWAV